MYSDLIIETSECIYGHGQIVTIDDVQYIVTWIDTVGVRYRHRLQRYDVWKACVQ